MIGQADDDIDPIQLELMRNLFEATAEEMGITLQRIAFSANIKERLDFSCAVFDTKGRLSAQAVHIPVHLGSMAFAMSGIVECLDPAPGDMVISNDLPGTRGRPRSARAVSEYGTWPRLASPLSGPATP